MSDELHDEFIIQLANLPGSKPGHEPRRVATPQGAEFYGQPIGTIITKDLLDKIHALKGTPPKGSTTSVKQGGHAVENTHVPQIGSADVQNDPGISPGYSAPQTGGASNAPANKHGNPSAGNVYTQTGYAAPNIDSTPPKWMEEAQKHANEPQVQPTMAIGIKPSSINGPEKFDVGSSHFDAPSGSRLIKPKNGDPFAVVITPDKELHFFTDKGEVEADATIKKVLSDRFGKKVDAKDTLYSEEAFDGQSSLESMAVGTHLHDKEGNKIFTKTDQGFVHSELGIPVDAKDIQPLHDSGELTTKPKPVAAEDINSFDYGNDSQNEIDFGAMTTEEFKQYEATTDPGDKLHVVLHTKGHDTKPGPDEFDTLTKQKDGTWSRVDPEGKKTTVQPGALAFIRKDLRTIEPTELQKAGTFKKSDDAQKKFSDTLKESQLQKQAEAHGLKTPQQQQEEDLASLKAKLQSKDKADKEAADALLEETHNKIEKKKADAKAIDGDAKQAISEQKVFDDEKADLNKFTKNGLRAQKLGELANLSFKNKALPGSRVITKDGAVYERTYESSSGKVFGPSKWKNIKTGGTAISSAVFSEGVLVSKNTFNGEEEWHPAWDGSKDEVGDSPTPSFLKVAPKGSIVSDSKYDHYHMSDHGWVEESYPNLSGANLELESATGKFKIIKIGGGEGTFSTGDKLNTEEDKKKFYEQALPGTKVGYYPHDKMEAALTHMTLGDNGVWHSDSTVADSYELHAPSTYGLTPPGSFYVQHMEEGTPGQKTEGKLGTGDHPTVSWMEHAPVGAGVLNYENGDIFVKKENDLWGFPGNPGVNSPAQMEHILSNLDIGDPGEDWEDHGHAAHVDSAAGNVAVTNHKAGDVASYQDVLDSPVGTVFHYHKKDGTLSNYSKLDENTILMPGGIEQPIHHWEDSLNKGKVTFAEDSTQNIDNGPDLGMPEPIVAPTGNDKKDAKAFDDFKAESEQAEKDLNSLEEESPELSSEDLDALHAGHKVQIETDDNDGHIAVETYTKAADGLWYEEGDPEHKYSYFLEEIASNATNGILDLGDGSGNGDDFSDLAPWELALLGAGTAVKSVAQTVEDIQKKNHTVHFSNGVPDVDLSEQEIWEAIEALQSHSHGSPVYGLKKLDDSNGVKNHQSELIDAAKKQFPKSTPKVALIAFLKNMVEPLKEESHIDEANNPHIHLGKDKPAKNQFGVTGGDFTQSDIEQAIDILENYDGKLYKSQLSKADNPLGDLDFNTLVGPNKDKLAQKSQVIEFLKTKVEGLTPVKTTTAADLSPNDPAFTPGLNSVDMMNKLDIGSKVYFDDGTGKVIFRLNDFGLWDVTNTDGSITDWTDKELLAEANNKGGLHVLNEDTSLNKLSGKDVLSSPAGTQVILENESSGYSFTLTKLPNGDWKAENGITLSPDTMVAAAHHDRVHLLSTPDNGPEIGSKITDMEDFKNLPIGTVVSHESDSAEGYTKLASDKWEAHYEDGTVSSFIHNGSFKGSVLNGMITLVSKPDSTPQQFVAPAAVQSAIANGFFSTDNHVGALPGQYDLADGSTMFVFNDGSAIMKLHGADMVQPLDKDSAAAIAAHPGWKYKGVPGTEGNTNIPPAKPVAKATAVKEPTVKIDPKEIPDGNYFMGSPTKADTPLWSISKGVVTSITDSGTKTAPVSQVKLKNAVLKGQLVDQWGNSAVLPKNHIGTVKFLNHDTTTEALKSLYAVLEDTNVKIGVNPTDMSFLANLGVYTNATDLSNFANATQDGDVLSDKVKESLKDSITKMLGTPDTWPFHDATGKSLADFDWQVGASKAYFPDYATKHFDKAISYYKSASDAKAAITDIGANFGDGHTIGQHVSGMNLVQKRDWLKAFQSGDFAAMYQIEVEAAIKQGQSHVGGWKHPGYPDNNITNHIQWAPAVPGEKSVDDTIPGEWSSLSEIKNASDAEIDNYLISASMQNPQHLSAIERHQWVEAHRTKNRWLVNALSVKAQQSKLAGEAPISSAPNWIEGVEPPKPYASLFVGEPYPVSWPGTTATWWIKDFQAGKVKVTGSDGKDLSPADLKPFQLQAESDYEYQPSPFRSAKALTQFFQNLRDQKTAQDLKPIYKLAPTQTVKQSKHPIFNVVDQFGNKYLFKPAAEDSAGKKYRADVEAVANKISKFFGGRAPDTKVTTFNGQLGTVQEEVAHIKTLNGFNWENADKNQTIDLANEHLTDWMLDQDDNWAPNTLIESNGHLVGVDKGRSFINYGSWKGMRSDSGMDVNTHLVYSDLYEAIKNKKISKELADATWLAVQRRAKKISTSDEGRLLELLHEATDDRKQWQVSYSIHGKAVPQTQQGFIDAFMDRKKKLPEQVEAMWKDMYEKAGYGDLPEPAPAFLGEGQHSGLDDEHLHTTAMTVGSIGASTLLGSPDVIGGTATLWSQKNSDGSKDINAQMYLGPKKQEDVLSWFKANSDANLLSYENSKPGEFTYDTIGSKFIGTAKTVGHHAEDGEYNKATLAEYEKTKVDIEKDQNFWYPGMMPENDGNFISFPSGTKVDFGHVDQYKMMLDYYADKESLIDDALAAKTKPSDTISLFKPIALHDSNVVYLDGKTQKLVKLGNGTWLYTNGAVTSIISNDEASNLYIHGGDHASWTKWKDVPESPKVVFKAVLGSTHEKEGTFKDFELSLSGSHLAGGNGGNEYEVSLPTGEKIYFRNSKTTNTVRGHEGRITIRVPGAKDDGDVANGMANAKSWLEDNLNLKLDAADHDNAELLYWREMYGILENRHHNAGSPWAKAKADLDKKIEEVGGNKKHFLENFAEKAPTEEQVGYFRKLWADHFGEDKVNNLVTSEGYLPYYESHDLRHPELKTGKPNWLRFDMDLEELKKKNSMLASSARSETHALDVIKSGGAFSTEERSRIFAQWIAGMSSSSDQTHGSSNSIFTRIMPDNAHSGISFVYHPRAMLRTRTYSFDGDHYGRLDDRKGDAPSNPLDAWLNFSGHNETMIPNSAALFGDLEALIFDNATNLNAAIQYLKSLGILEIRGHKIEDRLVMRKDLTQAIAKLKQDWYKKGLETE